MTLSQAAAALNEKYEGRFGTDFAGYFDITDEQAERIAEKAATAYEFISIWENEGWWA